MTKEYYITLKNIDILSINEKYSCANTISTTNINELNINSSITYIDEIKNNHVCNISMIDFQTKQNISELKYNCYWCRHSFDSVPIGCPIKYVSTQIEKNYYSYINQDKYTIKESVTVNKLSDIKSDSTDENLDNTSDANHILVKYNDYYETDGVFCSFNCCKSWINDNKTLPLYQQSTMLLSRIFSHVYSTKNINITCAPHWRMLKVYGGNLSITKFRDSFFKVEYKSHGIVKKMPPFISIGVLYEEKLKISKSFNNSY